MQTPWGEVRELQDLTLPRGRGALAPEISASRQRRRLFGAMVAALAEKDYAAVTIEDLKRLSGVRRNAFYEQFESKEDCLLQAVGRLYDHGVKKAKEGLKQGADWEQQLRAGFTALMDLVASQPDAARMAVVEVYAAGPKGSERFEAALAELEQLLYEHLQQCERRRGLPRELIGAIVGGIQMLVHDRLRQDKADELPAMASEIMDWALSYETPPQPLREEVEAPAVEEDAGERDEDQRQRIVRAVAEICATDGVTRLTVLAIAAQARFSLRTLYEHFPGGGEEAFLASFEEIVGRCLECSRAAYQTEREWPAKMHAVNRELFAYLASEPDFAKTVLVEVFGAGPAALASRDLTLAPFGELFDEAKQLAPQVPKVVKEAIVFAVYSLVGREIEAGGGTRLARLVPIATYIEVAPYLGSDRAAEVANGRN